MQGECTWRIGVCTDFDACTCSQVLEQSESWFGRTQHPSHGCAGFFEDASFGCKFISVFVSLPVICRTVHNLDIALLLLIGNEKTSC